MNIDINIGNEHILENFPNFDYANPKNPELLNFFNKNNITGDQQRAFVLYHVLDEIKRELNIGLDLGCGQWITPFCLGIDRYCGYHHPIYGGYYSPHLTWDCHKLPFNDSTFGFIVVNHIIEHLDEPVMAFKEWIRILKINGVIILIIPDTNYEPYEKWDSDHRQFFTPQTLKDEILDKFQNQIKTEVYNTFNNNFSINYVGRKING